MFKFAVQVLFCIWLSNSLVLSEATEYLKEPLEFIRPCNFSDSQYIDCMRIQTQRLFDQLDSGIPGLKNVHPLKKFRINQVKANQGSRNVRLKTKLTNLVLTGLENLKVEYTNVSPKNFSWNSKFLVPKLRIDSDYDIDGKILIVPIKGNGTLFIEIENMRASLYSEPKLYKRDGFTFWNVTTIIGDIYGITGLKTELKNLFNGNKELEKSVNEFFNENWKDVYEALKPIVQQTVSEIVLDIIKKIYTYIPADFFLPEISAYWKESTN